MVVSTAAEPDTSGAEHEFYDAANPLLAIGNPLRAKGVFFEKCCAGDA